MKIYISGSITNNKDYLEIFRQTEASLRSEYDCEIINPAEITISMPKSTTRDEYMAICMELIKQCNTICMIAGWEESEGAKMEYVYAVEHGMNIIYNNKDPILSAKDVNGEEIRVYDERWA